MSTLSIEFFHVRLVKSSNAPSPLDSLFRTQRFHGMEWLARAHQAKGSVVTQFDIVLFYFICVITRRAEVYAVAFCLPSIDGVVNLLFAHFELHCTRRSGEAALALELRLDCLAV